MTCVNIEQVRVVQPCLLSSCRRGVSRVWEGRAHVRGEAQQRAVLLLALHDPGLLRWVRGVHALGGPGLLDGSGLLGRSIRMDLGDLEWLFDAACGWGRRGSWRISLTFILRILITRSFLTFLFRSLASGLPFVSPALLLGEDRHCEVANEVAVLGWWDLLGGEVLPCVPEPEGIPEPAVLDRCHLWLWHQLLLSLLGGPQGEPHLLVDGLVLGGLCLPALFFRVRVLSVPARRAARGRRRGGIHGGGRRVGRGRAGVNSVGCGITVALFRTVRSVQRYGFAVFWEGVLLPRGGDPRGGVKVHRGHGLPEHGIDQGNGWNGGGCAHGGVDRRGEVFRHVRSSPGGLPESHFFGIFSLTVSVVLLYLLHIHL